jgi:hypothetical protein
MYRKNVAGQFLPFALINATTGAALTGATVTAVRTIDGGSQAACTGTVAEMGGGQYRLALSQADTNGDNIGYLLTASGAIPAHFAVTLTAADPTDAASFGITRIDAAITSRMATYTQPTGFLAATFPGTVASPTNITAGTITTVTNLTNLPAVPTNWLTATGIAAGALNGKGDWNIGKTGYALTAGTGLGNQTANITGNLSGSVGSVTGAVGSVTGNVGGNVVGTVASVVGSVGGNVTGSVGSVTGLNVSFVDVAISSRSTYAGGDTAGTTTLLSRLDATRAGLLDNLADLDVAVSTRQPTGAVTLTTAGNEAVADALLNRNVEGGGNTGALVKEGFYFLRLKWNTTDTPGVLTVYREDGTTVAWTRTLAVDPTADPITGLT